MEKVGEPRLTTTKNTSKIFKNMFGVPCSKLKKYLHGNEIPCTSESEAMAMAAGAWFTGKKPIVYMQNSGLGNIIDIVKSLYEPYNIPLPHMILSMRKHPKHHKGMYLCTKELLDILKYRDIEIIEQETSNK